jgi:hypothetical protein
MLEINEGWKRMRIKIIEVGNVCWRREGMRLEKAGNKCSVKIWAGNE